MEKNREGKTVIQVLETIHLMLFLSVSISSHSIYVILFINLILTQEVKNCLFQEQPFTRIKFRNYLAVEQCEQNLWVDNLEPCRASLVKRQPK